MEPPKNLTIQLKNYSSTLQKQYFLFSSFLQKQQYDVIVFSHLRWEFVIQRPQHVITLLSKGRKVLYVEEPIGFTSENKDTARIIKPTDEITILQPRISWDTMVNDLKPLLKKYTKKLDIVNPILWFYSPMFLDLIHTVPHSLIVYDCMDELSAFKGAHPQLISYERNLLNIADVVFTGGKSLYESKITYNSHTYCFSSSVDSKHFEKARKKNISIPRDLRSLPGPVVGFYGVIDERIDLDLLEATARICPDVSFVMIGPVVKISEESLPKRANIYYLGSKKYEELPLYLKGFDIAFMPFALNESTKFISPTKTLEFMAAFKPIISTNIYDVSRDYSHVVPIVGTANEMKRAIKKFLYETEDERKIRVGYQEKILKTTSWKNTVSKMKKIVSKAIERKYEEAMERQKDLNLNTDVNLQIAYD